MYASFEMKKKCVYCENEKLMFCVNAMEIKTVLKHTYKETLYSGNKRISTTPQHDHRPDLTHIIEISPLRICHEQYMLNHV